MNLKKLEISGFKSFATTTVLEFPSRITAIVGPNGSGKSNIAEALRWVLGEQSIKTLRGKKGEDLIWNGSTQVPRMGKASVTLIFDNRDGRIPLDFDEVALGRKIFRDGLNEYFLNDSQVRLKDIVELMARLGLGESKHNIIGQGDVDRILLARPIDRRDMLEEALGLRVYQIKKHEAERKLEATENNVRQAEALVAEVRPHLKFLRDQARKAETRGVLEEELRQLERVYFAKEEREAREEKRMLEVRSNPLRERHALVRKEIERLQQEIVKVDQIHVSVPARSDAESVVEGLESRRREIEREIGRLEGKRDAERETGTRPSARSGDTQILQEEIHVFISEVRTILEQEDQIDVVRAHLFALIEDLEKLLQRAERGGTEVQTSGQNPLVKEIERTIQSLQEEVSGIAARIGELRAKLQAEREVARVTQQKAREFDKTLVSKQDEERDLAIQLERFKFDEERIRTREEALTLGLRELGLTHADIAHITIDGFGSETSEGLRRKIERLRGKLEEVGGIDASVVKEYQDAEARHEFLTKEIGDLKHAQESLHELVKELDQHVKRGFETGFAKIKDEFQNYFSVIFSGGKATLRLVEPKKKKNADEEMESLEPVEEVEEGIDISVDLPRKRIKGLAMLSGGERTLTSIALLLAISSVNPPPFLVLDETDAALDEANSKRYAAILQELSKKTQLILVTHNRETMTCAGVLYGVTMGENGVSKLISLKLEEAEVYTNR